MKSNTTAVAFPTYAWIHKPNTKFLFSSYSHHLSLRDSQKCRRLIESPWFQSHWGDKFKLSSDQNQKHRFENDHFGYRIATSVDGTTTGEGGDIIVIDDPHNIREAESPANREAVLEWWDQVMSTRLNDPNTGVFIVVMQRANERDVSGHILATEAGWDHLVLPAEYEKDHIFQIKSSLGFKDPRTKDGELLWPTRFGHEALGRIKSKLGSYGAAGQLQQRPAPRGGGILQYDWWLPWEKDDEPPFEYILQSWDTAFSERDRKEASYSACTTWGVFVKNGRTNVMILDAWRDRVSYPELRRLAKEKYDIWHPDEVLIEKKASGQSLIQDLRMARIPVMPWTPDRSGDKEARAHAAAPLLEGGMVWYPHNPPRRWTRDVLDWCASFPAGDGADIVDTVTQALLRLRNMWYLQRADDDDPEDEDEQDNVIPLRRTSLYG